MGDPVPLHQALDKIQVGLFLLREALLRGIIRMEKGVVDVSGVDFFLENFQDDVLGGDVGKRARFAMEGQAGEGRFEGDAADGVIVILPDLFERGDDSMEALGFPDAGSGRGDGADLDLEGPLVLDDFFGIGRFGGEVSQGDREAERAGEFLDALGLRDFELDSGLAGAFELHDFR